MTLHDHRRGVVYYPVTDTISQLIRNTVDPSDRWSYPGQFRVIEIDGQLTLDFRPIDQSFTYTVPPDE